jgi:hypothetical protein
MLYVIITLFGYYRCKITIILPQLHTFVLSFLLKAASSGEVSATESSFMGLTDYSGIACILLA